MSQEQYWQGPLPPPASLAQYRDIVDDLPERIVAQWEQESAHRRDYENRALEASVKRDERGQGNAIVFALSALVLAGFALWAGYPWVTGVVGGGTIASVVGAFLYQQKK